MAGVTSSLGVVQQIFLIAGLRRRLFLNLLRSATAARFDLLAKIGLFLIFGIFAAGGAIAFYVLGSQVLINPRLVRFIPAPLWAMFLVWQVLPVFLSGFHSDFEFRQLLRFPLRYGAFFLLSLAYGLFDAAPLMALLWLTSFGLGILFAQASLAMIVVPTLALFALVCLLLNRVIYSWMERWLASRRGREVFFLIFIGVTLSFQFVGVLFERMGPQGKSILLTARMLLDVLPPGLAATILQNAAALAPRQATVAVTLTPHAYLVSGGLLALFALLFLVMLHRRLQAQYQGEDLGEAVVVSTGPQRTLDFSARMSERFPLFRLLRDPVAALVEKELRYMVRNPAVLVNVAVPLVMVLFLGLIISDPPEEFDMLRRSPELVFPAAIGYTLLVVPVLTVNCFAFESRGIQFLFSAPVSFREVLLAKNLALGGVLILEALLIWPLITMLGQPPSPASLALGLSALLFTLPVYFSVGNILSLNFPRAFDFGRFRQKQSGAAVLFFLLLQIVLGVVLAGVVAVARWKENLWIAAVTFTALGVALLPVYREVLESCSRRALERRETLTNELCR